MTALYADDTKVYRNITSVIDGECLQQTNLHSWFLTVTHKKSPVDFVYHLGPEILCRVHKAKYLGIILSHNLFWVSHIQGIATKANKLLGLLKRTCPLLQGTKVRRTLYLSIVKSQL